MNYKLNGTIVILLISFFFSCGSRTEGEAGKNDPVPDSVVRKVQTAAAITQELSDVIKLNGKIIPSEKMQAKVYALVSGRIRSVSVELGDYVRKGQALAVLQSSEVAGVTNDLSVSESNLAIAKKSMESIRELYQSNLATERDYINSQLEYNKARSELNRAKQVAAITGGNNSITQLNAPISGFVTEKTISNNSQIRQDNNNSLFTIADLSNVWIIANVHEGDINNIHLGDQVIVNTLASPDKDYTGTIDKIYNVLDPSTRTMRVRISMKNPNNELKPEMFATITVKGTSRRRLLSIPSMAVVLDNSKHYVIVQKDPKSLEIREVQIIKRVGDTSFVTGLSEGERVVTNSEVFLFEALNTK